MARFGIDVGVPFAGYPSAGFRDILWYTGIPHGAPMGNVRLTSLRGIICSLPGINILKVSTDAVGLALAVAIVSRPAAFYMW